MNLFQIRQWKIEIELYCLTHRPQCRIQPIDTRLVVGRNRPKILMTCRAYFFRSIYFDKSRQVGYFHFLYNIRRLQILEQKLQYIFMENDQGSSICWTNVESRLFKHKFVYFLQVVTLL